MTLMHPYSTNLDTSLSFWIGTSITEPYILATRVHVGAPSRQALEAIIPALVWQVCTPAE
jgi:uncharacterized membrane protein